MSFSRRRFALLALGVFLLALLVRLVAVLESADEPYHQLLALDAATYHRIALEGDPASPFWQPPLYPWFLRALYASFGPQPLVPRLVQALVGALVALGVVFLARRYASELAALFAGLAAALAGSLVYFDGELLPASLGALIVTAFMLTLAPRAGEEGAPSRPLLRSTGAGALLGFGGILLPTLAFPGALALAWWWRRAGLRAALLLALVAALPVAGVAARNYAHEPDLVPVSWNGGVNFYIGNGPEYPESVGFRPGIDWSRLVAKPRCEGGAATAAEESAWFYAEALREGAREPLGFAARLASKAAATLSAREIGRNREPYAAREESLVLRALLWPGVPFVPILVAAALGASALIRARKIPALPLLVALGILLGAIIFFPTARYRTPALPALLVVAAAGLPRVRPVDAIAGVAALGVSLVPTGIPRVPSAEVWAEIGSHLEQRGQPGAALSWYERALDEAPANADFHLLAGLASAKLGAETRARQHLERAVALRPEASEAWRLLGIEAGNAGDHAGAERALRRALEADPCNHRARAMLAHALMNQGLYNAAAAELERAARDSVRPDPVVERARARLEAFRARSGAGGAQRPPGSSR